MLFEIIIILYSINVLTYISIQRQRANKFLKNLEGLGIPPHIFIGFFDKLMFRGSFIVIFLGFVLIVRELFFLV